MQRFTEQEVLDLIPSKDLKAVQQWLDPKSWSELGGSDRAVWGKLATGKRTLTVVIDTVNQDYFCNCTVRARPCKHCFALMMLTASQDVSFASCEQGAEPQFVLEAFDIFSLQKKIIEKLQEKSSKDNPVAINFYSNAQETEFDVASPFLTTKSERASCDISSEADLSTTAYTMQVTKQAIDYAKKSPALQGKRLACLRDLRTWLGKAVREGLFNSVSRDTLCKEFFEIMEAFKKAKLHLMYHSMMRVSSCIDCLNRDDGDTEAVRFHFMRLLKIYLDLFETTKCALSFDKLDPLMKSVTLQKLGIEENPALILAQEGVHDTWLIIDHTFTIIDNHGKYAYDSFIALGVKSRRIAMVYNVEGFTSFKHVFQSGELIEGTMYFYPGISEVRRALFKPQDPKREGQKFEDSLFGHVTNYALPQGIKFEGFANWNEFNTARMVYNSDDVLGKDFVGLVNGLRFVPRKDLHGRYFEFREQPVFIADENGQAPFVVQEDDLRLGLFDKYLSFVGEKNFSAFVRVEDYRVYILGVICDGQFFKVDQHYSSQPTAFVKFVDRQAELFLDSAILGTKKHPVDPEIFNLGISDKFAEINSTRVTPGEKFFAMAKGLFHVVRIISMPLLKVADSTNKKSSTSRSKK